MLFLHSKTSFRPKYFHCFPIFYNFYSSPWNQTSLSGYFIEMTFQTMACEDYLIFNGSLLLLLLSMCWHHQTFFKMLDFTLHKFDHPDKNRNDEELLCWLIRFHIAAKQ